MRGTIRGTVGLRASRPRRCLSVLVVVGCLSVTAVLGGSPSAVAAGKPSAPPSVTATVTDPATRTVTVSWRAPADTGGAAVHYDVFADGVRVYGYPSAGTTATWSAGNTSPEHPVTFTVDAANSYGTSAATASDPVTVPAAAPGAPNQLAIVATPLDGGVRVSWQPPAFTGGDPVTGYTVSLDRDSATCSTSDTTCTLNGLTNGKLESARVSASNAVGAGPRSDGADFTVGAPAAPGAPSVALSGTRATVSFDATTAPPGYPVTRYEVDATSNGGAITRSCGVDPAQGDAATSFTCSLNLPDRTEYSVAVVAVNANGRSAWSPKRWFIVDSTPPVVAWTDDARMVPVYGSPAPSSYGGPQPAFQWASTGADPTAYVLAARRDTSYAGRFASLPSVSPSGDVPFTFRPGHTVCTRIQGADTFGLIGASTWSKCAVFPVDDRSLATSGTVRRLTGTRFYQRTLTTVAGTRNAVVLRGVRAGSVVRLLGWNCDACGPIRVYYGRTLVRTLSASTIPTGIPFSIGLPTPQLDATVTIRPGSNRRIQIDGLSVGRRG